MKKKPSKQNTESPSEDAQRCPKCGSTELSGLVASFYVPVNQNGDLLHEVAWESESEIGPERLCRKCYAEFSFGDTET